MEYKSRYTKEEAEELVKWFESHKYENELKIDKAQHITDLKKSLTQFTYIALTQYDNPNFSGFISNLFKIREELIKQGKVIE
ncbi:MAG: hypothetical protein NC206_07200 [Bacteroides sp.]|nr:hypothetical protein [Roseburia sp.]MCM1346857.1 hypothetical protein [Bacteroides sp.]MCM1419927.1 hypothetical protein [Bacteroides sp.]